MPTSSLSTSTAAMAGRLGQALLSFYNGNLLPLEIVAVIVTAGLVTATVMIIVNVGWFATRVNRVRHIILKTDLPKKHAKNAWAAAQKHFFAGNANDLKMAVMEADNILNDALRYAGISGINLGDRLKNVKRSQMPNIEDVWAAHKLRNEIAHETNFYLKRDLAERALETYETALKNLGAFD